jgi:hypothetical protein
MILQKGNLSPNPLKKGAKVLSMPTVENPLLVNLKGSKCKHAWGPGFIVQRCVSCGVARRPSIDQALNRVLVKPPTNRQKPLVGVLSGSVSMRKYPLGRVLSGSVFMHKYETIHLVEIKTKKKRK